MADFDDIDRGLLAAVQLNDRQSFAELGRIVGLSVSATKERVDKLTARGVITGFHAHLDAEAVGLDLLAYVFVGWSNPDLEAPFLARVKDSPNVLECHHVTGVWNYALKVRVKNPRALETLLSQTIKAAPGVERTETIIALSTVKETAILPTGA